MKLGTFAIFAMEYKSSNNFLLGNFFKFSVILIIIPVDTLFLLIIGMYETWSTKKIKDQKSEKSLW